MSAKLQHLGLALLGLAATLGFAPQDEGNPCAPPGRAAVELRLSMRKLWEEQHAYARHYLISALAQLPDRSVVLERLLEMQDEIGNAVRPYLGSEGGNTLARLLRENIKIGADLIQAVASVDEENLAPLQRKWSQNGVQIAGFLSDSNPSWSRSRLEQLIEARQAFTTGELVARLKKDWATDLKASDAERAHLLILSDALVDGIVEQFPEEFPR
ncbi:MAG TPA: glycosyltransferase [Planctomycetota bacterium]|nr:glycosyltransferase [Planctomycetota bacterium]